MNETKTGTSGATATVNGADPMIGLAEIAQRCAVKPSFEILNGPNGEVADVAVLPTVEPSGRVSVKLQSVKEFFGEYRKQPERRLGTANMGNLASLIDHVNRFKDADSVVFTDPDRTGPSITAVIDYHRSGHDGAPRFGTHRSRYAFPVSDEWKAWTEANKEEMTQGEFADFIESRIVDVVDPSQAMDSAAMFANMTGTTLAAPAKLLELSRGLSVNVEAKVTNIVNLQSGEKQVQFSEAHSGADGAPLKVPGAFLIGIPVFRGEDRYQVCVRLRYRKSGGALVWFMELWRHEEVFDAAIKESCEAVKKATGLPLLVGKPE